MTTAAVKIKSNANASTNTNSKATKKTKKNNISQTLPTNFKYGVPMTPHINPLQPSSAQKIPTNVANSCSLPPANVDVGTNITTLGSLSLRDSTSMPAKFFMGPNANIQPFKLKPDENKSNATNKSATTTNSNKMIIGSFPCLDLMGGAQHLNQLKEDEEAAPSTAASSSTPDTFADDGGNEEVLFDMDDMEDD